MYYQQMACPKKKVGKHLVATRNGSIIDELQVNNEGWWTILTEGKASKIGPSWILSRLILQLFNNEGSMVNTYFFHVLNMDKSAEKLGGISCISKRFECVRLTSLKIGTAHLIERHGSYLVPLRSGRQAKHVFNRSHLIVVSRDPISYRKLMNASCTEDSRVASRAIRFGGVPGEIPQIVNTHLLTLINE